VKKGKEKIVQDIFDKWDLNCVQIGEVTEGGQLEYYMNGELVAKVPAHDLVLGGGAPVYDREYTEPAYFAEHQNFKIDSVPEPANLAEIGMKLLGLPNIASKRWIYEQYDTMVGTRNMSTNAPSDAGIANIKDSDFALAMTVDCNARYVHADPKKGTAIAVAEAARNISCTGGEPSAITNCLNFGNPYNPEDYWQFVNAIKGMGEACLKFKTPVTGGNVSFYNQTVIDGKNAVPVFPTPTIGMIGIIKDKRKTMSLDFKEKGDLIFLLGESRDDISSSEYLANIVGIKKSPTPYFNLDEEFAVQKAVRTLIEKGIVNAAHDVSDGGLYTALVEMGLPRGLGFDITGDAAVREDAFLFGEAQGRILVALNGSFEEEIIEELQNLKVPFSLLGHVTRGKMVIDDAHFGFIDDAATIYNHAIERKMDSAVEVP